MVVNASRGAGARRLVRTSCRRLLPQWFSKSNFVFVDEHVHNSPVGEFTVGKLMFGSLRNRRPAFAQLTERIQSLL
jgi:hypothetical protein